MPTTTSTSTAALAEATRLLAEVCDHASSRDNAGFNGTDTGLGHWLAGQPESAWTADMAAAAYVMLGKYRRQLSSMGVEFDSIEAPVADESSRQRAQETRVMRNRAAREGRVIAAEAAARLVSYDGSVFVVTTARYVAEIVAALKAIPGRRWNGSANLIPATPGAAAALLAVVTDHGFTVAAEAQAELARLADAGADLPPEPKGRVTLVGDEIRVSFDFDREIVNAVKNAGARWNGDSGARYWRWSLSPSIATKALGFIAAAKDFAIDPKAIAALDSLAAEASERREASRAHDADLAIEGLGGELRPFQRAGVAYILRAKRTFVADDMGTGKTVQALAAILQSNSFPAVVVCPASMKLSWRAHVNGRCPGAPNGWLPGRKVAVLEGTKPDPAKLRGADVVVINYDILHAWLGALKAFRPQALVLDESHYVKTKGSKRKPVKRTAACLELAAAVPNSGLVLCLSGTPLMNKPVELTPQLEILGRLKDFGGFMGFARRYCGAYQDNYGRWDFSGSSKSEELSDRLRELCYLRRKKEDVMPELPAKVWSDVPTTLSNLAEYRRVEADVIAWLRDQVAKDEEFLAEIADLDDAEKRKAISDRQTEATTRAARAQKLVELNKLRVVSALGKVKPVAEWVTDFLLTGEKLILFAEHKQVQKALAEQFPGCVTVLGDDSIEKRQSAVRRFQEDPEVKLIVCSLKAAREGLTMTAASNVAFVEQAWTPAAMSQAEDRAHRMGQDANSVNIWTFMAPDSIDEDMRAILDSKRAVVTAVADGQAEARDVSVVSEVVSRLLAR